MSEFLSIEWEHEHVCGVQAQLMPGKVRIERTFVKRIELPEVGDEELPVMVRLQAGAKSSVALEELALDFIPLPRRSEVPGREVLLATVPRQTMDEVIAVCRSGGLE